jgi:hypothetical protein
MEIRSADTATFDLQQNFLFSRLTRLWPVFDPQDASLFEYCG